ncbi:aldolase [Chloroflexota bacterium]
MEQSVLAQFQTVGSDLFHRGLLSSHSGNLSIRKGERVLITRHGCMLGHLYEDDVVEVELTADSEGDILASIDLVVHRAIYRLTSAQAIVHAHPTHAIALSLTNEEILPVDVEGEVLLKKVPVVGGEKSVGPGEGAEVIARALQEYYAVLARGHGCFTVGKSLEEACHFAITVEESSRILYLLKALSS